METTYSELDLFQWILASDFTESGLEFTELFVILLGNGFITSAGHMTFDVEKDFKTTRYLGKRGEAITFSELKDWNCDIYRRYYDPWEETDWFEDDEYDYYYGGFQARYDEEWTDGFEEETNLRRSVKL